MVYLENLQHGQNWPGTCVHCGTIKTKVSSSPILCQGGLELLTPDWCSARFMLHCDPGVSYGHATSLFGVQQFLGVTS